MPPEIQTARARRSLAAAHRSRPGLGVESIDGGPRQIGGPRVATADHRREGAFVVERRRVRIIGSIVRRHGIPQLDGSLVRAAGFGKGM